MSETKKVNGKTFYKRTETIKGFKKKKLYIPFVMSPYTEVEKEITLWYEKRKDGAIRFEGDLQWVSEV